MATAIEGTLQVGRPSKHNWEAQKAAIKRKIKQGKGVYLLAKHYGMSVSGMKLVLQRLGLQTLGMKNEEGK